MIVLCKLQRNRISHPRLLRPVILPFSLFSQECFIFLSMSLIFTALCTLICYLLLRIFTELQEMLSEALLRCRTKFSQNSGEMEQESDDPSPSIFLCVSCCFCFHCFFSSLHQNHFQLACDSRQILFSIEQGRFPGHFSGDDECSSLSGTLFQSQTV